MKPGFVAEAGSELKASIDPCPESDCDCHWWDKNNTKSLKSLIATKDTNKKENQQLDRTHKTVRLYPNPTSDGMFIIACNNNTIPYNLKILNSTGNIIFSQEKIKTRQKQLSIASFPTGVNLVHISSGKFIKTFKIIYQ